VILRRFGTNHRLGEAAITIDRTAMRNSIGEIWAFKETWSIKGRLLIDETETTADLTNKILQFENLYNRDGGDVVLYQEDGTTPTAHAIYGSQTLSGIQCVKPLTFSETRNAEYVKKRTYTTTLEALKPVQGAPIIHSFTEKLSRSGGGPMFAFLEPNEGFPILQQIKEHAPYIYTQSGTIVGIGQRPSLPQPLWPAALLQSRTDGEDTPTRMGEAEVLFPRNYEYRFGSVTPLTGNATSWT
jgi:hypothetical protein